MYGAPRTAETNVGAIPPGSCRWFFQEPSAFLFFDAGKLDLDEFPGCVIGMGPLEIVLVREALNPLVSVGCADVPVPHPFAVTCRAIAPRKGQGQWRDKERLFS